MEFIATSGNLHLEEMVAALIATGVITQDGGQCVRDAALRGVEECHPLEFIAGLGLPGSAGEERLTLDVLTDWLADWCGLERVHIDPLRVDVSRVTAIMSLSYARRYGILCLDASADEIVVATMQPFEVSWLQSLQEFVERSVRRVVASPEQIKKYSERFYSLKASVVGAGACITNRRSRWFHCRRSTRDQAGRVVVAICCRTMR
jgi:general secretion pathway protein E